MLYRGDCLEIMPALPPASVDMILCDLPYGTTACSWDCIIPFVPLWAHYKRLIRSNGTIALTASQPFTSALVMSNPGMFRVEWIWEKNRGSNFATTKYLPMKEHESVLIFGTGPGTYNPIKEARSATSHAAVGSRIKASNTGKRKAFGELLSDRDTILSELRCPRSIQRFNVQTGLHDTQKPVELCKYFISTYTNHGDVVLDNCMGSGSTGVAAIGLGREFIGIEKDSVCFDVASDRLSNARALAQQDMFALSRQDPHSSREGK